MNWLHVQYSTVRTTIAKAKCVQSSHDVVIVYHLDKNIVDKLSARLARLEIDAHVVPT